MSEALDAMAVADAVAEATATATTTTATSATTTAMPRALPTGWLLKESRSHPGFFYYFFIPTGLSSWHSPVQPDEGNNSTNANASANGASVQVHVPVHTERSQSQPATTGTGSTAKPLHEPRDEVSATLLAAVQVPTSASTTATSTLPATTLTVTDRDSDLPDRETLPVDDPEDEQDRASKRRKAAVASAGPKEVRVLHILKKHKDSRRPSSWRQAKITSVSLLFRFMYSKFWRSTVSCPPSTVPCLILV